MRRAWRVTRALWRFARGHVPKWLLPVLAVCVAIPGPQEELIVLIIVLTVALRTRDTRRELATAVTEAWRG